jgi:hypothetical protein
MSSGGTWVRGGQFQDVAGLEFLAQFQLEFDYELTAAHIAGISGEIWAWVTHACCFLIGDGGIVLPSLHFIEYWSAPQECTHLHFLHESQDFDLSGNSMEQLKINTQYFTVGVGNGGKS